MPYEQVTIEELKNNTGTGDLILISIIPSHFSRKKKKKNPWKFTIFRIRVLKNTVDRKTTSNDNDLVAAKS